MLQIKVVALKKLYKFSIKHFLIGIHQNAKRYEARNTEREARRLLGRAPQARSFLRAKRADF